MNQGLSLLSILFYLILPASAADLDYQIATTPFGVTVRDLQSGTRSEVHIRHDGSIHAFYTFSPENTLVESQEFLPGKTVRIVEGETPQTDTWYFNPKKAAYRVTSWKSPTGPSSYEVPVKPGATDQVCAAPGTISLVENFLKEVHQSTLTHIDQASVEISGCRHFAGGPEGLIKEMKEALKEGLSCTSRSSPETRAEMGKLMAYLKSDRAQIHLFCAHSGDTIPYYGVDYKVERYFRARSLVQAFPNTPGIILNLQNLSKDTAKERKATLFHEMVHWTGSGHETSFDTPYLTEFCCFGVGTQKTEACKLLNSTPRPSIYSTDYLKSITSILIQNDRRPVAFEILESAIVEKMKRYDLNAVKSYEEIAASLSQKYPLSAGVFNRLILNRGELSTSGSKLALNSPRLLDPPEDRVAQLFFNIVGPTYPRKSDSTQMASAIDQLQNEIAQRQSFSKNPARLGELLELMGIFSYRIENYDAIHKSQLQSKWAELASTIRSKI